MNLRNFLLFLALTVSLQGAYAQDVVSITFTIGNLKFYVYGNTCSVSAASRDISGDIAIPSTVEYERIVYPVTAIEEGAFTGCLP